MTGILDCGHEVSNHSDFTTGYGVTPDNRRICYECCAGRERQSMLDTGKATLYLVGPDGYGMAYVTDWPGRLSFRALNYHKGHHNIARVRYDVDFIGPDGYWWHGVSYGDNTQIVHCKRTKDHITTHAR